jgi:hypothetical protein
MILTPEPAKKPDQTPSKYQQAVYDKFRLYAKGVPGHLIVSAVAGSGKTTTIVNASAHIPNDQSAIFLAFNKHIAEELKRRLPAHVESSTTHSAAYRAIRQIGRPKVDSGNVLKIWKTLNISFHSRNLFKQTAKLVGGAKAFGYIPEACKDECRCGKVLTPELWANLISYFDIAFESEMDATQAVRLAEQILTQGIRSCHISIDFDDMLYIPYIMGLPLPQYQWVIVDEAQDLNVVQRELIKRMLAPNGHGVFVGDERQCQPAGSMILVPGEVEVPIETLKTGDHVVPVDISHSCFKTSGEPVEVASRPYCGMLVEATSAGRVSRYTPDHDCVVNAKPLADTYVVYLMERGGKFRVGSTKFGVRGGSGLRTRLCTEHADNAWILSVWGSKQSAVLEEALIAHYYGFSERTFVSQTADGSVGLNQQFLDRFWEEVSDQTAEACALLAEYGRYIEHPFVSAFKPWTFNVRRPCEVKACNMLEGMLVLHSEEHVHYKKHAWKQVERIRSVPYSGLVYSLNVPKYHTYVADGIATHNCIYGFRGSDSQSMARIKEELGADQLPLSICYRCSKSVIRKAQGIVPHIEWFEGAPEGSVNEGLVVGEGTRLSDVFQPHIAVLCPYNAPLIKLAFKLLRQRIACRVIGRDIGEVVIKLLRKLKAATVREALGRLDDYYQNEVQKHGDDEAYMESLNDRIDTLRVFLDEAPLDDTTESVEGEITRLFSDAPQGGILTLSTIHKAKGLEWDEVYLLDHHRLFQQRKRPVPEWIMEQRKNLAYVGFTRARKNLTIHTSEGLEKIQ